MAILSIQIDQSQHAHLQEVLNPKQYRQALFQATKRTTNSLRTRISREIRERSYAKKKEVDKALRVIIPKNDGAPVGEVRIRQVPIPLIAFRTKATKKNGVTATYGPGQQPVHLRHAFKAKMKSGHEGIYMRGKRLPSKGPNAGKGRITRRGFAGRFVIQEVMGPSIYSLMNVPDVLRSIQFDVAEVYTKNLNSQIDRFLKPRGVTAAALFPSA